MNYVVRSWVWKAKLPVELIWVIILSWVSQYNTNSSNTELIAGVFKPSNYKILKISRGWGWTIWKYGI